jgi:hypothetical protein
MPVQAFKMHSTYARPSAQLTRRLNIPYPSPKPICKLNGVSRNGPLGACGLEYDIRCGHYLPAGNPGAQTTQQGPQQDIGAYCEQNVLS